MTVSLHVICIWEGVYWLCPRTASPAVTDGTANKLAGRLFLATAILFDRVFMASTIRSPVPSPTADFTTQWAFLEEGINNIMTRSQVDVPLNEYWILQGIFYNCCTSSGTRSTTSSEQSLAGQCLSLFIPRSPYIDILYPPAGANMMGSDLYNSLFRYFVQHVRHLRDVSHWSHWRLDYDGGFFCSIQIHYKTNFS
jgi:hypothetical protein